MYVFESSNVSASKPWTTIRKLAFQRLFVDCNTIDAKMANRCVCFYKVWNYSFLLLSSHVCILSFSIMYMRLPQAVTCECIRVQPRGRPHIRIFNGVQNSRCPENTRKKYIGCPHPHKPELGEGTRGAGPFRVVLYSNSCAANLWHGHLTYLLPLTGFIDMFNSCGQALSQGGGSDFQPSCNWEETPSGSSTCMRSLGIIGSMPWGHTCPDLLWLPSKAGRTWECWYG